jgi:hypothetical protein
MARTRSCAGMAAKIDTQLGEGSSIEEPKAEFLQEARTNAIYSYLPWSFFTLRVTRW